MYEHKIIKANDKAILVLQKDKWWLCAIANWKMYFKRAITRTNKKSIWEKNKEWLEFKNIYKDIKNSWLSNNILIVKYNKLCDEWLHKEIIENLKQYKIYLEATKKKDYALMAQTYINQERHKDEWEVIKDFSKKFINDIYKEKKLNAEEISNINIEVQAWEVKQNREITDWIVRNIINIRLNK